MKIKLFYITIYLFVFSFFPFVSDSFASSKIQSAKSSVTSIVIKDDNIRKIISSGKLECKNRKPSSQNKRQKKIAICPIKNSENGGLLSLNSKKFLTTYFYIIRNVIYIVCCLFLVFIWARIRWQKFPEWKLFYNVFMILVITTIVSGIANWYFISGDVYLYHCQKPNVLWQLCKKGKNSITVKRKNLIALDSDGKLLKAQFISSNTKNRYKVNMFY